MSKTELLKNCRICESDNLHTVFSLGDIYPSNFITEPLAEPTFDKLPLELVECADCSLVQLKHTYDLDSMYRQYWYQSGLNPSMRKDLKDIVDSIENILFVTNDDIVLDIGCNDGTLFDFYSNNPYKIGFDPAYNLAEVGEKKCVLFINDYFRSDLFLERTDNKKAKVVTSVAMFYDLPDPNVFTNEVREVLAFDGLWVIQFTDLYSMFKINAFDNICHEHLEYYTLQVVNDLLTKHNFTIFNVEYNKVNGGSIRIYVKHSSCDMWKVQPTVNEALDAEKKYFNSDEGSWVSFEKRHLNNKMALKKVLRKLDRVAGLGASTKGNTLLQTYNLGINEINAIGEINKDKFGTYTIGSNIPILPENYVIDNWDIFIILPWHFVDTFINNPKLKSKLVIFPLPEVKFFYGGVEITWNQFLKKASDS